jgi:hypothetical protein
MYNEHHTAVVFLKGEVIGEVTSVTKGTQFGPGPPPLSILIRNVLKPVPGKEDQAEALFEELVRHVWQDLDTLRSQNCCAVAS